MVLFLVYAELVVVVVFSAAVTGKTRNAEAFRGFRESLVRMRLAYGVRATMLAVAVPAVEITVAGLTVVPATAPVGLMSAAGLLAVFSWAIAREVRAGTGVSCRCFGAGVSPLSRVHLLRNLLLILVAVAGAADAYLLDGVRPDAPTILVAAFAAVATAATLIRLDDVAALMTSTRNR